MSDVGEGEESWLTLERCWRGGGVVGDIREEVVEL